jgi:hypothetical protein
MEKVDPKYFILMLFYTAHSKQQERYRLQEKHKLQRDFMLLMCCAATWPRLFPDASHIVNDDRMLDFCEMMQHFVMS